MDALTPVPLRRRVHRRHLRLVCGAALCAATLTLAACGDDDPGAAPTATASGFVEAGTVQQRNLRYLRYATQTFSAGSVLNVLAHMERTRVDPGYTIPHAAVPGDAWDGIFAKMAALEDTRDFDALYVLNILLGYRHHPALDPVLVQKIEDALIGFKFWYTEPTPPGLSDDSYYWTENHEAIYHTIEYLVGQTYPDRVFPTDGKTGREHQQHARDMLMRWFDLRGRFGFFEWHSNVYYQKDATPLLTLVEYANDDAVRTRAAAVLDMLLFDIAMHTFRGAFGTTHGRSYKKDKMSSLDDDTWNMVKLLFDTAEYDYNSADDAAALFARARRYRLPEVIFRAATAATAFADRERMGIALDELAPYEPNPVAPYGLSFTDPNDLPVWWSMGAVTTWQTVPLTVQTLDRYDLWNTTNFSQFAGIQPIATDLAFAQQLAQRTARFFSFGLLKEVNTYTYRTADYMLSSAQDYRAGSFGWQYHSWQATFDPNALVFTTHPTRPPLQTTDWYADTETGSYWTGEASMPRSAQHQNVAIHIYAPQYNPHNPAPFDFFRYEPYTHAYFPQDHFDEVVQDGAWTLGRFRDGYIALYSFRPATWVVYDPTVYATNGMVKPFDLRADGGADNVWIAECGRQADWGSFEQFRAAITASRVEVTTLPKNGALPGGFDVLYASPSQGRMTFGWNAPLTINGSEVPLTGSPRYDNPWSQTPFDTPVVRIADGGGGVELDFEHGTRRVLAAGGE